MADLHPRSLSPALAALAQALIAKQQRPMTPPSTVQATPPPLPPYQQPGAFSQAMMPPIQPTQPHAMAPPAAPQPMPAAMPNPGMNQQPLMDAGGMAPAEGGMMKLPQTNSELEAWRAMMDKLQFARQGQ